MESESSSIPSRSRATSPRRRLPDHTIHVCPASMQSGMPSCLLVDRPLAGEPGQPMPQCWPKCRLRTRRRARRFRLCRTSKRVRHQTECSRNQTQTDRGATVSEAGNSGDKARQCESRSSVAGRSVGEPSAFVAALFEDRFRFGIDHASEAKLNIKAGVRRCGRCKATAIFGKAEECP